MTKTTCLILEKSDFTKDSNLKKEAFDAMCFADVVIHGERVVKNRLTGEVSQPEPDPGKPEIEARPAYPGE